MTEAPARRGRPPDTSTADTRKRILHEATKLIARQGFHATSVAEIGNAAGIQSGALYYHIKSKDELLWQILLAYITDLHESTQETAAAHEPPEKRIRALIHNHVMQIVRYRLVVTIYLRDHNALSKAHHAQLRKVRDDVQQLWQQAIEDGVEAGVFRSADRIATNAILTMLNWVSQWYRPNGPRSAADVADVISDLTIGGLRNH